jgi:hypothetical protein
VTAVLLPSQSSTSTIFLLNNLPVPCLQPKLATVNAAIRQHPHRLPHTGTCTIDQLDRVYSVMGRQSAYIYNPPGDQTTPLMFLESSRLSTYLSRQSPSLHGMPILRVHDVPYHLEEWHAGLDGCAKSDRRQRRVHSQMACSGCWSSGPTQFFISSASGHAPILLPTSWVIWSCVKKRERGPEAKRGVGREDRRRRKAWSRTSPGSPKSASAPDLTSSEPATSVA